MRELVMPKIKIIHKGLVLVIIPLLAGLMLDTYLCIALSKTNSYIEHVLVLKDAMISYIKSTRAAVGAKMCAQSFLMSRENYYKETYQWNKKEALSSHKHLKALLKNERGLKVPELQLGSGRDLLMMGRGGGGPGALLDRSPFLEEVQYRCNQEMQRALRSLSSLEQGLCVGILACIGISGILAWYFNLNITQRLLIIIANTNSLSKGTLRTTPVKGSDEIAELDRYLSKSADEIKELEKFKREMIGLVSHELKSPLSSVGTFLKMLEEGVYGTLGQKAQDKAERTYSSVKRLMNLVAELLILDRLELKMQLSDSSINEVLNAAVDGVKELSEKSGIEIVTNSQDSKLVADKDRLVQVIINLLSNAMKFSPAQGKVTVETSTKDNWFECRVSDQGKGIPEAFRKQIFEPFKQVDTTDATTKKGTGLGLTISRSIVEQHGGIIRVESEENKGSTFWFRIPIDGKLDSRARLGEASTVQSLNLLGPSNAAEKSKENRNAKTSGKYGVLKKGLAIIAIPLLFQCCFSGVLFNMLGHIREQTHREEKSKQILDEMNNAAMELIHSSKSAMLYVLTKNPGSYQSWNEGRDRTLQYCAAVGTLSGNDPKLRNDIDKTVVAIEELSRLVDSEAKKGEYEAGLNKLAEANDLQPLAKLARTAPPELLEEMQGPGGQGRQGADEDGSGRRRSRMSMLRSFLGSTQDEGSSKNNGERGNHSSVNSSVDSSPSLREEDGGDRMSRMKEMMGNGGMEKLRKIMGRMTGNEGGMDNMRGGFGAILGALSSGGMGGLGAFSQIQSLLSGGIHVKMVKPFMEAEAAQNRLMDIEKASGEQLAAQRSKMINLLQLTLYGGITLNILLSLLLARSLMNSMTSRLQHVSTNTARLVKREALDPPLAGTDEIAYLDRILYENGTHLIELESFKHQLISIVSHELRTPLLSISSALEMFGTGAWGELTEKGNVRLRIAQEESSRLIRLINELLDIEKMEAGKFVLDISVVDVAVLVKSASDAVIVLSESKQLGIETIGAKEAGTILADYDRLCQVLINLLSNAIKFSPEGAKIQISVKRYCDADSAERIKFSVSDQGRGIPDEMRKTIFDRFVQVDSSDASAKGGTGLGLAISKGIVEQHGGEIGVDSTRDDIGSTFWFRIPVLQEKHS